MKVILVENVHSGETYVVKVSSHLTRVFFLLLLFKHYLNTTFALRSTKCSSRELTSEQLTVPA